MTRDFRHDEVLPLCATAFDDVPGHPYLDVH